MSAIRYLGATIAESIAYARETLGDEDLLRVFDLDGDGAIAPDSLDERAFVRAVASAETEVDECLAASHGAPFRGEVSESVREIVAQRSVWCAVRTRGSLSEAERVAWRQLYKDTDARLERLQSDRGARIPNAPLPSPTSRLARDEHAPTTWQDLASRKTWGAF